jgi:hypothetical protein
MSVNDLLSPSLDSTSAKIDLDQFNALFESPALCIDEESV